MRLSSLTRRMWLQSSLSASPAIRSEERLAGRSAVLHHAEISNGLLVFGNPSFRFIRFLPLLIFSGGLLSLLFPSLIVLQPDRKSLLLHVGIGSRSGAGSRLRTELSVLLLGVRLGPSP